MLWVSPFLFPLFPHHPASALGNATATASRPRNTNDLLQQLQQLQQMQQLMAMMENGNNNNNAGAAPAQQQQNQQQAQQQNTTEMFLSLLQQQQRQQTAQEEQEQQQLAMTTAEQLLLSFAANAASNNNTNVNTTVQQQQPLQVLQNINASQTSQQQPQPQMPDLSQLPPQIQLQLLQQQMEQQSQQQQVQGAVNAFQNTGAAPQANLNQGNDSGSSNDCNNNTETQFLRQQLATLQQQLLGSQQQQPQQPMQQPNTQAQPQNVQNNVANQLLAIQQQQQQLRLQQQQLLNMMAQNPSGNNNTTTGGVLPSNLQQGVVGAGLGRINTSNEGRNQGATLLGSRLPPMQQLAALQNNNMGTTPNLQQQYQMLFGQQQQQPQQAQAQPPANPMLDFLALMKSQATNTNNDNSTSKGNPVKPKAAPSKPKRARKNGFPEKLMQAMLDNKDDQVVAWLPDGRSFVIVDPDLFCSRVLKETFKEVKYPSFVRKLQRWGFVRLTSGTGTDCFYHPLFQKGNKELAGTIQSLSRTGGKLLPSSAASKPPSLAGVEKFIKNTISSSGAATTVASPTSKATEEKNGDD